MKINYAFNNGIPEVEKLVEEYVDEHGLTERKALMTSSYYMACLDLEGRRCLVVGGGAVGLEKAAGLARVRRARDRRLARARTTGFARARRRVARARVRGAATSTACSS